MDIKPIIPVKKTAIEKARKAGARVVSLWITPLTHETYEGRKRNARDYFYGMRAECDKVDLLYLEES